MVPPPPQKKKQTTKIPFVVLKFLVCLYFRPLQNFLHASSNVFHYPHIFQLLKLFLLPMCIQGPEPGTNPLELTGRAPNAMLLLVLCLSQIGPSFPSSKVSIVSPANFHPDILRQLSWMRCCQLCVLRA